MNTSAKTDYACLALIELAAGYGAGRLLRAKEIADAHGIPPPFLVQILLQLKAAGIVGSTRGVAGGYQLLRDPQTIRVSDVVSTIESAAGDASCAGRDTDARRAIEDVWRAAIAARNEVLQSATIADLAARARQRVERMYYI